MRQDAHDEISSGYMVAASLQSIRIYLDYGQAKKSSLFSFRSNFFTIFHSATFVFRYVCDYPARRRHDEIARLSSLVPGRLCTRVRACVRGSIGSILSSYYIVATVYVGKLPRRMAIIDW